jgi:uncharacterized protein (TIGR03000 family)
MSWLGNPLKATVLAAAALLFAAGSATAQHGGHGGGGHGGGGHGGGGHGGGGGYHAGYGGYHHGGYGGYHHGGYYHHGYGYYPGFYGFGLGLGYGLGYGLGSGYYPYYGGYNDYSYAPDYYAYTPPPVIYRSYYPNLATPNALTTQPPDNTPARTDNTAHVRVIVPASAEIWFDGDKTSQTGATREFVSPALTPGSDYTYQIKARWMENGQPVEKAQDINVRAGAVTLVDFTRTAPPK